MKKLAAPIFITLVLAGSGGFYGGMAYQKTKSPAIGGLFLGGNGQNMNGARVRQGLDGAGVINGEILSKDDKSITIKDRNGGSRIVFLAPSTNISKMADGSENDLAAGINIMATGTMNSDGSITAQNIQIRPAGGSMPTNAIRPN